MQNQPNPDDRLAQKGTVSRSIGHTADRRSLKTRPGIKHRSFASSGQALTSREMDVRNSCIVHRNRAGLNVFVKGGEGNRSPTFREGKRYPPVVVLPLLQRVFQLRVRFEPKSAKISFFFQVIRSQIQI